MKKVGIDLDGVVADFCLSFSKLLREKFGDHIPIVTDKEQVLSWDWHHWVPITEEEYNKSWTYLKETPNFWESLSLINPYEFNYLNTMIGKDPNIDVYFITTREPSIGNSVVKQSVRWLHGHGWEHPHVIATKQKGKVCNALGIEYFVDDSGKNCVDIAVNHPDCKIYLMDFPHNRKPEYDHFRNIKRIHSLVDFANEVLKEDK